MNRSRVFYPSLHGIDGEGGGAADLQTDVMRFMAILSLCLVAIFALVQSIPVVQSNESPAEPEPEAKTIETLAEPVKPEPPKPAIPEPVRPEPVKSRPAKIVSAAPPEPHVVEPPRPEPVFVEKPPVAAEPAPALPSTGKIGFTLQFETDHALTNLVAANEVGLYAITPTATLRLSVDNDRPGFWQASLPGKYHEMDASTVPDAVVRALSSSGHGKSDLKWGVTLPSGMTRKLNQYLANNRGGALIIGGDGALRLEK